MKNAINPANGLGHQLTELLFGLQKARSYGLSYVFEPFTASGKHKDNYTFINELLGLPRLFASLGGASRPVAEEVLASSSSTWEKWNESHALTDASCNVFRSVGGYSHCTSASNLNCFIAPEHAFLYQNAADCFRNAVVAYGTAFDHCIFDAIDMWPLTYSNKSQVAHAGGLPHDTIVVAWHVRLGDLVPHPPSDPFFKRVLLALRQITEEYKLIVMLIGKGSGTDGVAQDYVDAVANAVNDVWSGSAEHVPRIVAPVLSFPDAFVAMMQADVLIGSGSSLPAAVSLVSGEPLFFNHVAKHGYNYGAEMLADSVDMHWNGTVSESLRRLRVVIHERMRPGKRRACR